MPNSKAASDFLSSFYVAGLMILQGQIGSLYPALDATTYVGLPFDVLTHRMFAEFPAALPAMYMYSPLVALFCVPFALLPPGPSLLAWQLLNVAAVFISATLCAERVNKSNSSVKESFRLFVYSFAFLPIVTTIWIGQLGILTATLPLAAASNFLLKEKYFQGGLLLSLMFLKPQVLPVALLATFGIALCRKWSCAAGLASGVSALLLANYFVLGPDAFLRWVHSLQISETLLSSATVRSPLYLIAGLPGAVISQLPEAMRVSGKLFVYGGGALLGVLVAWILYKIARSPAPLRLRTLLILIVAAAALPVFSPRLLLYDLCVYLPAALLVYSRAKEELAPLHRSCNHLWMLINAYILFVVVAADNANPLILACGLAILQIPLWRAVLTLTKQAS